MLQICSKHFVENDYWFAGSICRLRKNVVPTIFNWSKNQINHPRKRILQSYEAVNSRLVQADDDLGKAAVCLLDNVKGSVTEQDKRVLANEKRLILENNDCNAQIQQVSKATYNLNKNIGQYSRKLRHKLENPLVKFVHLLLYLT